MHPRIEEIVRLMGNSMPSKILNNSILLFLKKNGVTQTEAIISIHYAWRIPIQDVQDFVYAAKIFDPEDINEVAYQTFKYM